MAAPRKQYTREFKQQAVDLITEQGVSLAQAARDLGLRENLLSRWKKELAQQGIQAFPGHGRVHEDELTKLRREVEILRREREILKKAVGIFSQPLP
jgi:transposase